MREQPQPWVIVTEHCPDYRPEFSDVFGPYGSEAEAEAALLEQGFVKGQRNDYAEWTKGGLEASTQELVLLGSVERALV